jgi:hypothetical protein
MPPFRRPAKPAAPSLQLTVGLRDNRVVVGGAEAGIAQLGELRDYVGSVTGHAGPTESGRDPVAVLSAKMDFAELAEDAASVVALAFEELAERGIVDAAAVPPRPELPPLPPQATTYEYIQAAHARAHARLRWLEAADVLLRAHDVAVLPPLPPEDDEALRAVRRR